MKTLIFTMVLLMTMSSLGMTEPKLEPPIIETRMWYPEDIESYYRELKADEIGWHEYWKATGGKVVPQSSRGVLPSLTIPKSVVMRNVAYGYLQHWPLSRNLIDPYACLNSRSGSNQAIHGKQLLQEFWRDYWPARLKLGFDVFGDPKEIFNQKYDRWEAIWGPDPPQLTDTVPAVPEEFDGKWFLSIRLETDNLLFYACIRKAGHIFGLWDSRKTGAQSHLISRGEIVISPYPVGMQFYLGKRSTDQAILFSDDVMQAFLPPKERWVEIRPLPYQGPSGSSPHISYEFDYPIYDEASKKWHSASAVLASAPGEAFREVEQKLKSYLVKGVHGIGEDIRNWAGEYSPPED